MLLTFDIISEIVKYLEYPDIKNFLQVNSICAKYMKKTKFEHISQIRSKYIKQKFAECISFSYDYFYAISFGQDRPFETLQKPKSNDFFNMENYYWCEPYNEKEIQIIKRENRASREFVTYKKILDKLTFLTFLCSNINILNTIKIHFSCNIKFFISYFERHFPDFSKRTKVSKKRGIDLLYVEKYYSYCHNFDLTFEEEEYVAHLKNTFMLTQYQMKEMENIDPLFHKIRQNTKILSLMTSEEQDERKMKWNIIKYCMNEIDSNNKIETCNFNLKIDLISILKYM